MAITGPHDLPVVMKVDTNPIKAYCLASLGHPATAVEVTEDQWEIIWRILGDFIAGYFPREQKLAVFYTVPLQSTYPMPADAYWIQDVQWDPSALSTLDIFSADYYLLNSGIVNGMQTMLTDFHLLQAYRKLSKRVLSMEGYWEVINEGGNGPTKQLIRLYPTPKGGFPVLVLYYPVVTHFRSPQAKRLAYDYALAETMIMLGRSRRKMTNLPSPTGGTLGLDGGDLVTDGTKLKEDTFKMALDLAEPMPIILM